MECNHKSRWINTILKQMNKIDLPQAVLVLENCGRECLKSSGRLEKINKLRNETDDTASIESLFNAYKKNIYDNSPNLYMENGNIYLEYQDCGCGMVTEGGVDNPFLCYCTIGYTKQIFEALFEKPVKVELLKSILKGDRICKQKISLDNI